LYWRVVMGVLQMIEYGAHALNAFLKYIFVFFVCA